MTGGLLQLVSYGVQDLYLTSNPQITFFKTNYKRYTNFSVEIIKQTLTGSLNFNEKIFTNIPLSGDLVTKMYLRIVVSGTSNTGNFGGKWAFSPNIGNTLINNVKFLINGSIIDTQYGEWFNIWNNFFENPQHQRGYNIMIGNTDSAKTLSSDDKSITLYIPLKFFFNRYNGLALPLIALQYSSLRIEVNLNSEELCYEKEIQFYDSSTFVNTNVSLTLSNPELFINYIFLDSDERKRFAKYSHEYLIEQVQRSGSSTIFPNTTSFNYSLILNHPCKTIFWVIKRRNLRNGTKYLSQNDIEIATKRLVMGFIDFATGNIPLYSKGEYLISKPNVSVRLYQLIENTYVVEDITSEDLITLDSISCDKLLTPSEFSNQDWENLLSGTAIRSTNKNNDGIGAYDVIIRQNDNFGLYNNYTGHTLTLTGLKLNGHDRFTSQNAKFFSYLQSYEVGNNTPTDGVYMYSFALFPFNHQPSGSCNFSKLESAILNIELPPNLPESTITAYAINYNVLKIMSGMGSLSYSS